MEKEPYCEQCGEDSDELSECHGCGISICYLNCLKRCNHCANDYCNKCHPQKMVHCKANGHKKDADEWICQNCMVTHCGCCTKKCRHRKRFDLTCHCIRDNCIHRYKKEKPHYKFG